MKFSKSIKKILTAFTEIAYKAEESLEEHLTHIPEGWKVLAVSTDARETSSHNFRAVAFVNEAEKKVIIANAGTDIINLYDLRDNIKIYRGEAPSKLGAMKNFLSSIIAKLDHSEEYSFETTGHSLGGVLADFEAVILKAQGYNIHSSVTFDNPGAKPSIHKAMDDGLIEKTSTSDLADIAFETVNARPNLVNTTNAAMGKMFVLIPQKTENSVDSAKTGEEGYVSYLFSKVGSILSSSLSQLNISTAYSAVAKLFDADYITNVKEAVHELIEETTKLYQSNSTRIEKIKGEFLSVMQDLSLISGGAMSIYYTGNIVGGGASIALGASSLTHHLPSLCKDLSALVQDAVKVVTHISRLLEHKLDNFNAHDLEAENLLEVSEGYSKEDTHVKAKATNKNAFAKIKAYITAKTETYPTEEKVSFVENIMTSLKNFFNAQDLGAKLELASHDDSEPSIKLTWEEVPEALHGRFAPDFLAAEPDEVCNAAFQHAALVGEVEVADTNVNAAAAA